MNKIILASSSVRRKALLNQIGLSVETIKPEIDEKLNPRLKPRGNAEQLSLAKVNAVAQKLKDDNLKISKASKIMNEDVIIIAADTFIVFNGEILGKPIDKKDAKKTLLKLSGKSHSVITGFTILEMNSHKTITKSVVTKVFFRKISLKEIDAYIKTGEPMNKAGSYGMQDLAAIFVERIEGEPFNVVGLPLSALTEELKKFGVKLF
jgi:septum formation protein